MNIIEKLKLCCKILKGDYTKNPTDSSFRLNDNSEWEYLYTVSIWIKK